jgi:hypothetical protein
MGPKARIEGVLAKPLIFAGGKSLDVLRQSEKRLFEIRGNVDDQDGPGHPASDPTQLERKRFWFGPGDR